MSDLNNELVEDKDVAHDAAVLTNKLIDKTHVPEGQRSQYSKLVEDIAIDNAERISKLERDQVTGVLLENVARERIAKRLESGDRGTLLVMDLVALKHLNTFSIETGNQGLKLTAELLKSFGFDDIGRKGDEFYCFKVGIGRQELRGKFKEFVHEKMQKGEMEIGSVGISLLTYWDCGEVGSPGEMDKRISELDASVIDLKKRVQNTILQKIEQEPEETREDLGVLNLNIGLRVEEGPIAAFINSLKPKVLEKYGIKINEGGMPEMGLLQKIPRAVRSRFHELQREALDEVMEVNEEKAQRAVT